MRCESTAVHGKRMDSHQRRARVRVAARRRWSRSAQATATSRGVDSEQERATIPAQRRADPCVAKVPRSMESGWIATSVVRGFESPLDADGLGLPKPPRRRVVSTPNRSERRFPHSDGPTHALRKYRGPWKADG